MVGANITNVTPVVVVDRAGGKLGLMHFEIGHKEAWQVEAVESSLRG